MGGPDEVRPAPEQPKAPRAMIVDADRAFATSLAAAVAAQGFDVEPAGSLDEARRVLARAHPDVILVALELPDGSWLDLVELSPHSELVVVAGGENVGAALAAMRKGAFDYLTRPFGRTRVASVLANVARTRRLERQLRDLRGELQRLGRFGPLVGRSDPMQEVYRRIEQVAPTASNVLVVGESGTGKELVAETIHAHSRRSRRPFLALSCGAVPPGGIEGELFGREAGGHAGPEPGRTGQLERCAGGTLFLDEITELSPELQLALSRALESGSFLRVGGGEPVGLDVRLIAATRRGPAEAVARGLLRRELRDRLGEVAPVFLPPLRDRDGDLELLAQHFLDELNGHEETDKRWTRSGLDALGRRLWHGNVRELRHAVHRAYLLAGDTLDRSAIQTSALRALREASCLSDTLEVRVGSEISAVERRLILATLGHFRGNKRRAARALGISLKTLYNRLNDYRSQSGL